MTAWGKPWGELPYLTDQGVEVYLFRKGQRCRWFTAAGEQVGPEHRNVVPALIWAYANGWHDPSNPAWLNAGIAAEIAANTRVRA